MRDVLKPMVIFILLVALIVLDGCDDASTSHQSDTPAGQTDGDAELPDGNMTDAGEDDRQSEKGEDAPLVCNGESASAKCFENGQPGASGTKCDGERLLSCAPSVPEPPECVSECVCEEIACDGYCVDADEWGNAVCVEYDADGDEGEAAESDEAEEESPPLCQGACNDAFENFCYDERFICLCIDEEQTSLACDEICASMDYLRSEGCHVNNQTGAGECVCTDETPLVDGDETEEADEEEPLIEDGDEEVAEIPEPPEACEGFCLATTYEHTCYDDWLCVCAGENLLAINCREHCIQNGYEGLDSCSYNELLDKDDCICIGEITGDEDGDIDDTDTGELPDGDTDEETFDLETTPVFDMAMIKDQATAECTFTNQRQTVKNGVTLDLWDVSYKSWESIDGVLQPITIRGYAAKPATLSRNIPGVVNAHGLGGCAPPNHATGPAALLNMFVIAYTGPGGDGGEAEPSCAVSEGLPAMHDNNYRLFDTTPDPRGSWFWGHGVAGMRALTCLETRPEVDTNRLGFTGYSAGGVVTLMSSSVDDRIKAGVPLSACGYWDVAMESPNAWQHSLTSEAGITTSSPQFQALLEYLGVGRMVADAPSAKIFMVNGSCDEFFPLTAHMRTYNNISNEKRLSISGNYDHGCYAVSGIESGETIEERATTRAEGAQRAWFRHWFNTDSDYNYIPTQPTVDVQPFELAGLHGSTVTATIDTGGDKLDVEKVQFFWSTDNAVYFAHVDLEGSGNFYHSPTTDVGGIPVPTTPAMAANAIWYVDVQYKTSGWNPLDTERFSVSSNPHIPDGLVPTIRSINNCMP